MTRAVPLAPRILLLPIGLLLSLWACIAFPGSESDFPFQLLMIPQDLPIGWFRDGGDFPEVPGADTRGIFFSGSTDPNKEYILISHTLSVYTTEAEAENAYIDWEMDIFPTTDWKQPEDISYFPEYAQDQYKLACINVSINENPIKVCRYLRQHLNLISMVFANIDDEAISLSELEDTLGQVDERMQDYTMTK